MRKTFILTLAMATIPLGAVPLAQAQQAGYDHGPGRDHGPDRGPGSDRGPDRGPGYDRGPGRFVSAPQRAQLHAKLQAIDSDVANAAKSGRISYPQSRELHHELSLLEQRLYGQARRGLSNDEFTNIDQGANRVRQRLTDTPPFNGPRHR